jgi:hypothetical protein
MWNKKSIENTLKKRHVVTRRHSCPSRKIRSKLKYSEKGMTRSSAQPAVVRKALVK